MIPGELEKAQRLEYFDMNWVRYKASNWIPIPNQEKAKSVEEADDTGSVWERRFSVPIHRETRRGQYTVIHGDTRKYTGRYTGRHGRDNREAVRIMIGPSSRPPLLPRRWSRCSNGFSSKIWNCGISFWQRLGWKWRWHRLYLAVWKLTDQNMILIFYSSQFYKEIFIFLWIWNPCLRFSIKGLMVKSFESQRFLVYIPWT